MCLRSMQQAIYSPDNLGHFGLAYPGYSHFTSPIRRYPDLLTHRVIKALLAGQRYVPSLDDHAVVIGRTQREHEHAIWEKLGLMLSACERRAPTKPRATSRPGSSAGSSRRVGEDFSGTVTGVASFGIFVTLDTLHVEGLVHVSELGGEYFQFNDALHELRGERTGMRYRLTDKVQVQVSRVDLEARRIEFRLVQGTSFDALRKAAARGGRWLAPSQEGGGAKPAALKGQTAKVRRAEAKKAGRPAKHAAAKSQEVGPPRGATRLPSRGAATDRQSRLRAARWSGAQGRGVALFLAFLLALAPGGFGGNEAFRVARAFTAILGACPIIARQSLAVAP